MKTILLKRKKIHNPQIDAYVEALQRGQKSYHVLQKDKGWEVKRIGGSDKTSKIFSSQSEAIDHAKQKARAAKSEVFIHDRTGLIRERHSYAPDPLPSKP